MEIYIWLKSLHEKKNAAELKRLREEVEKALAEETGEEEVSDVCTGIAEKSGEKPDVKENSELIIKLESFGQISPEAIFERSIDELRKDLEDVSKKLK